MWPVSRDVYPSLNYGELGAIALSETHGRWEWSSMLGNSAARVRATGHYLEVFPATRPPSFEQPSTRIKKQSEKAAAFLRTHLPDVDVPSELIREELEADAQVNQKLKEFDPLFGAHLATVYCRNTIDSSAPFAFLAFSMGELNEKLNLSPFAVSEQRDVIFRPSSRAVHVFETPILQISSSDSSPEARDLELKDQHLAIRTFSSTSILKIEQKQSNPARVQLVEKANILSSHVGHRPLVDVKLSHSQPITGIVVNDRGDVYSSGIHNERVKTHPLYSSDSQSNREADGFWRLSLVPSGHHCLLASSSTLRLLDSRSKNTSSDLFSLRDGVFTAIEDVRSDHLLRLVSTSEVLWFDERSPARPLLGFKHGRQFDRSLSIQTVNLATPFTFLTSRRNGLVTVYDVSASHNNLLQFNGAPYCLQNVPIHDGANIAQVVLQHPVHCKKGSSTLFRMHEQGSIYSVDMSLTVEGDNNQLSESCLDVRWSNGIRDMQRRAAELIPELDPFDAQDIDVDIDFQRVYEKLFKSDDGDVEWGRIRDPEVVYESIEKIPLFWQMTDGQVDTMLTTFDIAFRSGREPTEPSRSDFFTQCAINSTRGYRALVQGRLGIDKLAEDAPWSCDISPTMLHHMNLPEGSDISAESFRKYDSLHENAEPELLRRQSHAREQLALDLALSKRIYSPRSFAKSQIVDRDGLDSVSRATEALSLNDEPPRVRFGFLQPSGKQDDGDPIQSSSERLTLPLGVRLLLNEWEVGADPNLYEHSDPYSESFVEAQSTTSVAKVPPPAALSSLRSGPKMISSRDSERATAFKSLSQGSPTRHDPTAADRNTDVGPDMANTQTVPGVYGGRLLGNKKKTVKKRLGGF